MKKVIISFLSLLIFSFVVSSCKKNDNSVSSGGNTATISHPQREAAINTILKEPIH